MSQNFEERLSQLFGEDESEEKFHRHKEYLKRLRFRGNK